ncbi:hypothetical protein ACA910_005833 [Epithemia clementina (nom. ined.)]
MLPDPYNALGVSHTATLGEIKKAYRDLARQYHPDRLTSATVEEMSEATKQFSAISSAYSLLMDPQRKSQYDHIYKYGGFDDDDEDDEEDGPLKANNKHQRRHSADASQTSSSRKRKKKVGVGYSCTDPLAFLWTSGDVLATKKIAGLKIPSRFQMGHPGAGFQVSISTGEFRYNGSTRQYTSRTTQFAHGKKVTKSETTTIHKDGRKEVLIQGDNFTERRTCSTQQHMSSHEDVLPWYLNAWFSVKDKLTMCYNPDVAPSPASQ